LLIIPYIDKNSLLSVKIGWTAVSFYYISVIMVYRKIFDYIYQKLKEDDHGL
jgi:hypothetical protein